MSGFEQDETKSQETKTVKLGHTVVELGKIHAYTYPTVISFENYSLIDAYVQSARIFKDYLAYDAPDYMRDHSDEYWKSFVNYLIFISKLESNPYRIILASISYNVLCKTSPIDLNKFHFTFAEMEDYYTSVFWKIGKMSTGESVGYEMVTPKGKILKRLKNHLFKSMSLEFPDVFWQFVGNMVKGFTCEPSKTVYWRITDNLQWGDGSFADSGSCMVSVGGSYRNGLQNLINNGAYAVQFFSAEMPKYRMDYSKNRKQYTNGIGRAWLILPNSDGDFIIVNGYGTDVLSAYSGSSKCTDKIADILSESLGINYTQVDFLITPDNAMYINDGGTCKYFSVDPTYNLSYFRYKFDDFTDEDYDDPEDDEDDEDDEDHFHCEHCGNRYHIDNSHYVENYGDYCEDCYDHLFTTCDHCEDVIERVYLTEVHNGDYVCETCRDAHYIMCADCNDYFPEDDVSLVFDHGDENYLCADCIESGDYAICDQCGEIHDTLTMHNAPMNDDSGNTGLFCAVCINLRG